MIEKERGLNERELKIFNILISIFGLQNAIKIANAYFYIYYRFKFYPRIYWFRIERIYWNIRGKFFDVLIKLLDKLDK